MEKSGIKIRTLGEAVDSGFDLSGLCFESSKLITGNQDRLYRVIERCPGAGKEYIKVVPLGERDRLRKDAAEPVHLVLDHHRADEMY